MLHVIKITDVKHKQAGRKKTMKAHLADKVYDGLWNNVHWHDWTEENKLVISAFLCFTTDIALVLQ